MAATTPKTKFLSAVALLGLAIVSFTQAADPVLNPPYQQQLDIPPRLQWNANYGYCGEVSFISAGLYYGQYCSQFTARSLASPGVRQSRSDSQLLLGVNDVKAAAAMKLTVVPWKTPARGTSKDFLTWAKANLLMGYPVVIGVFTNEYLFYDDTNRNAGDPDYDHIVPMVGVGSDRPLNKNTRTYNASDVIFFSDNGLWDPSGPPQYVFTYKFGDFPKTRRDANAPNGTIYSLKNGVDYGIVFTGVVDPQRQTIPVRLATNLNYEQPSIQDGSNTAPTPMALTLAVTVLIPDQTAAYKLYLYNDFSKVPTTKFNANAGKATQSWTIPAGSGATYTMNLPIMSNQIAVFRAVRATAP